MKKLVEVKDGEIFAIPLFVANLSPITRFTKKDFAGPDKSFAFMRVITDTGGSGIIIEIFDLLGNLATPLPDIIKARRLFRPIAVTSLPIYKKRWPRLGIHPGFDRERDSGYSAIELVMSPFDHPKLWRGGSTSTISVDEAGKYEPWTYWGAHHLERRILEELQRRTLEPESS